MVLGAVCVTCSKEPLIDRKMFAFDNEVMLEEYEERDHCN